MERAAHRGEGRGGGDGTKSVEGTMTLVGELSPAITGVGAVSCAFYSRWKRRGGNDSPCEAAVDLYTTAEEKKKGGEWVSYGAAPRGGRGGVQYDWVARHARDQQQ
jgi:hypothetical protein